MPAYPLLTFLLLAAATAQFDQPQSRDDRASEEVGTIAGSIVPDGGGRLPAMVVYLESTDPDRHFPIPTDKPVVKQKGAKFEPALLIISVGQTVEFPNDEDRPVQHNVFSKSPAQRFDLGLYRPGKSKSVTFDEPGAVRLHCSIHKRMDGVVYVCPTPFFAKVGAEGRFAIENVPAGEYELRTWQRKRRYLDRTVRVTIAAGGAKDLELKLSRN